MILFVFLQAGQFVFCTKQLSKVELYGNVKYVGIYVFTKSLCNYQIIYEQIYRNTENESCLRPQFEEYSTV